MAARSWARCSRRRSTRAPSSAIGDNQLRPALRPKIEVTSFDEGKDLEFELKLEVLPEVPAGRARAASA